MLIISIIIYFVFIYENRESEKISSWSLIADCMCLVTALMKKGLQEKVLTPPQGSLYATIICAKSSNAHYCFHKIYSYE